ncbi:hypothetical protein PBI_KAMPE_103 [Gordonia phage Kampe]|uniref:Uncharacterized protein n=3 Tax=Gordonia phage Orchid TaxID=1838075 RepID=A0A160DHN0_9CAUD|nr:hypothetical protein BH761_gp111 [Gordonia phage Orchid]ANA87335.1 hypothetical protein PBI_PATRICKSTAR_103 [Gordonia phage PatrickStar]ANA87446.1 hypothetical protein PBI_ORCHID_102 [Gordonia phage Orchid]ANA87561.1 hypothetical protein PBI_KAMPE_103 [Gordonia phage Kampe]
MRISLRNYAGFPSTDQRYMRLFRWITGATKGVSIDIETLAEWSELNPGLLFDIAQKDKALAKAVYYFQYGKFVKAPGSFREGHELQFDANPKEIVPYLFK